MTSYDDDADRSDLDPAYGLHLHDLRFLEYVGAPDHRVANYWIHHMGRDWAILAALQLQHDAGLILSNLQVLGQFVTSLNIMSSEVMQLAFAHKPFRTEAVLLSDGPHTTCLPWGCDVRRVPRVFEMTYV